MSGDSFDHYKRLAANYDENWNYGSEYVRQFSRAIVDTMGLTSSDTIADIGCGTGLYTRQVYEDVGPERPILCVDPVQAMLAQLPDEPGLLPVQASAEEVASGRVVLPTDRPIDAIIIKEAIHHVDNQSNTLAGLADTLAPGGRILVAMLRRTIRYPLFRAALERFEELQPDPGGLKDVMEDVGLSSRQVEHSFTISVPKEQYLKMVRSRYMSLLSTFDDRELGAGVEEIDETFDSAVLTFPDDFAFVLGVKR